MPQKLQPLTYEHHPNSRFCCSDIVGDGAHTHTYIHTSHNPNHTYIQAYTTGLNPLYVCIYTNAFI